jgi:hypothetical protein
MSRDIAQMIMTGVEHVLHKSGIEYQIGWAGLTPCTAIDKLPQTCNISLWDGSVVQRNKEIG